MPAILTADKHKELGDKYSNQALEIYERDIPTALEKGEGIAELQEKAESLQTLSQKQYSQWESLKELEANKEKAHMFGENTDNDPSDDEKQARDKQKQAFAGDGGFGLYLKTLYNFVGKRVVTDATQHLQFWDGDDQDRARVQKITNSKALAENTGATGGFLVPAEFQARVLSVMALQSIIRPRATIYRMNRRTLTIPVLNQQGTVSGGASWFGGIVTYYKDEAASLTETSPSWRDVTLTAHKLTGMTYSTEELLADSAVSLSDHLMGDKGFPGAFADRADYDYFQGSGVGKPEGILNSNALITTGGATGGTSRVAADDVQYEDLTAMLGKGLPTSNLIWVASQSVLTTLMNMKGPSGNASYLWGNAVSGIPNTLLGRPIFFTDKLPALGSTGDIMLIDPSYYLIGDRQAITIDMSVHNRFETDEATWRAIMRHDGQSWLNAPITYRDSSTTVSPFVGLAVYST